MVPNFHDGQVPLLNLCFGCFGFKGVRTSVLQPVKFNIYRRMPLFLYVSCFVKVSKAIKEIQQQ